MLPLLSGQKVVEGNYDNPKVMDAFVDLHKINRTWLDLKKEAYTIKEGNLPTEDYPFPKTDIYVL